MSDASVSSLRDRVVAIFAPLKPNREEVSAAYELGYLCASLGGVVLTNGTSGGAESASQGAQSAGGRTSAVVSGTSPLAANPFSQISLPTGLNSQFTTGVMAHAASVVFVIGSSSSATFEINTMLNEQRRVAHIGAQAPRFSNSRFASFTSVKSAVTEALRADVKHIHVPSAEERQGIDAKSQTQMIGVSLPSENDLNAKAVCERLGEELGTRQVGILLGIAGDESDTGSPQNVFAAGFKRTRSNPADFPLVGLASRGRRNSSSEVDLVLPVGVPWLRDSILSCASSAAFVVQGSGGSGALPLELPAKHARPFAVVEEPVAESVDDLFQKLADLSDPALWGED